VSRLLPRLRWGGLGLGGRVTVTFAVGALLVSAALAAITYATARHYFLGQRQAVATRQSYLNAAFVRDALKVPGVDVPQVLASLNTIPTSLAVLDVAGHWYETDISLGQDSLPAGLRSLVRSGVPATQTFVLDGVPELAVGVPLPQVHAAYFEVFSLEDVQSSLQTLAGVLLAAAAATTLAGAVVGRWAAGRALRPLRRVARAAVSIAGGNLGTRLEVDRSPDLADLASSFNLMADELQARIEREARFTADVNHELRSPLTTLVAAVGVLEAHRHELPERSRRALELATAELQRFQRMVVDLLEISRIDAGAAELALDEVGVEELVRNALGGHGSVPVRVDPKVAGLRIRVDKRRIERVIANLVDNAAAYAGGVSDLAVEGRNGTLRLVVEDRGPGVDPKDRQRIFERFARGQAAKGRRSEGSGLGLALVAEHVRLHQGKVWVDERPGGGARFVVELPVRPG
jgi:two-component system sensor histidine kinase MtrB